MRFAALLAWALTLALHEIAPIGVLWMIPSCGYRFIDATEIPGLFKLFDSCKLTLGTDYTPHNSTITDLGS